jgi:hypothetical protein
VRRLHTKRAVDGILDLVQAASGETNTTAALPTRSSLPCAVPSIRRCCRPSSPFRSASLGAPSTRFRGRRAKAAPRGAADARLRAARAGLRDAVRGAHMHAGRGEPISRRLQARAGMHAGDTGLEGDIHCAPAWRRRRYLSWEPPAAGPRRRAGRAPASFSLQHLSELGKLIAGLDVVYPPYVM